MQVDLESRKIAEFLAAGRPKLLRLALVSPRSPTAPLISSVWYLWKDGLFWITTSEDRLKVAAIRRNRRAALIVDTDVIPYKGVIIDGLATLTKRNIKKVTLAIVKKYVPRKYVKKEFEDLMKYPRVLIKVKPLKAIDIMSFKTR